MNARIFIACASGSSIATRADAQTSYTKDRPDSLLAHAKITEAVAAATAQACVLKGTIHSVGLEKAMKPG